MQDIQTNRCSICFTKGVKRMFCDSCSFWISKAEKRDEPHIVRANGQQYAIHPDSETEKGFAGRKFKIRFNDGREVETHNLWHQGRIPQLWAPVLRNNATLELI